MKLLHNKLLINSKIRYDELTLAGGFKLILPNKYGDGEHDATFGTVVEVGNRVKEFQVDDIVYFSFIQSHNAAARDGAMIDGNILIDAGTVFCYFREGIMKCRENVLIVKPNFEKINTTLFLPENHKKVMRTEGVVLASYDEEKFPIGALINYEEFGWQPFEYELHATIYPKQNTVVVDATKVNLILSQEA